MLVQQGWFRQVIPAVLAIAVILIAACPISAAPGQLSSIVLNISPDQVVGKPFIGTARILLLDDLGGLVPTYDLAANPITLQASSGTLSPSVINDPLLFVGGVVNLETSGITLLGESGQIAITATNGTITSAPVIVSFNGYDILAAFDFRGNPISQIYTGLPTKIKALVRNSGTKTASAQPELRSYFTSGGSSLIAFFAPGSNGQRDTILINLPTENLTAGPDTIMLELKSKYLIGGTEYTTIDYLRVPVIVQAAATMSLVNGSFKPDSVYRDRNFAIAMNIATNGFTGQIDSTALVIALANSVGGAAIDTMYIGPAEHTSFAGGVISYSGIIGNIATSALVPPGWYRVMLDYQLISGGNIFTITNRYPDSIQVLAPANLTYSANSISPRRVVSGREVTFTFTINYTGTVPLEVDPASTSFQLSGGEFSTTTSLAVPNDLLVPGANSIATEQLFIPSGQVGNLLNASVTLAYRQAGAANYASFSSNFGGQTIAVEQVPIIQVVSTYIVAPNSPLVNTGQHFEIVVNIANLASSPANLLPIRLVTDGQSTSEGSFLVNEIAPMDTTEFRIGVEAAPEPSAAEVFRVDVLSQDVVRLSPIDNIALATIQRPAFLELSHQLLGTVNSVVERNTDFSLQVKIANFGEAAITDAEFQLSTGGLLGLPEPYTDTIVGATTVNIPLRAPNVDTIISLHFVLTKRPIDRNVNMAADINDTSFDVSVYVSSQTGDLLIDPSLVASNLLRAGVTKDLLRLDLTNRGSSTMDGIRLDTIHVVFSDERGVALDPAAVFSLNQLGFYDGDQLVSSWTLDGDIVNFIFASTVVPSGETKSLVLRGTPLASRTAEFQLRIGGDMVHATYLAGPLAGQPVTVATTSEGPNIISQIFVPTQGAEGTTLVIRDNPFNPDRGPAEFRYLPPASGEAEMKIFTLLGELVYSRQLTEADLTPSSLEPFVRLEWNGRNDEGHVVLNGAYVVTITATSGEIVRLKVAVLK